MNSPILLELCPQATFTVVNTSGQFQQIGELIQRKRSDFGAIVSSSILFIFVMIWPQKSVTLTSLYNSLLIVCMALRCR